MEMMEGMRIIKKISLSLLQRFLFGKLFKGTRSSVKLANYGKVGRLNKKAGN